MKKKVGIDLDLETAVAAWNDPQAASLHVLLFIENLQNYPNLAV